MQQIVGALHGYVMSHVASSAWMCNCGSWSSFRPPWLLISPGCRVDGLTMVDNVCPSVSIECDACVFSPCMSMISCHCIIPEASIEKIRRKTLVLGLCTSPCLLEAPGILRQQDVLGASGATVLACCPCRHNDFDAVEPFRLRFYRLPPAPRGGFNL